jgi:glutaredoxin
MSHHDTRHQAATLCHPSRRQATSLLLGLALSIGLTGLAHSSEPPVQIFLKPTPAAAKPTPLLERLEGAMRHLNEQLKARAEARAPRAAQPVTLFVSEGCPYCEQARRYLDEHGISYQEVDTSSPEGAQAYAKASAAMGGSRGVPLLVRNEQRVKGFGRDAYDRFFEQ